MNKKQLLKCPNGVLDWTQSVDQKVTPQQFEGCHIFVMCVCVY